MLCLEEHCSCRHRCDFLECQKRVAQVVEHTEEHHEVKRPEGTRFQVVDAPDQTSHVRVQRTTANVKAPNGIREGIDRDNLACPSVLCLEGEEAFGTSNVQDTHTRHVIGKAEVRQLFDPGVRPPGSYKAISQIDLQEPVVLLVDL